MTLQTAGAPPTLAACRSKVIHTMCGRQPRRCLSSAQSGRPGRGGAHPSEQGSLRSRPCNPHHIPAHPPFARHTDGSSFDICFSLFAASLQPPGPVVVMPRRVGKFHTLEVVVRQSKARAGPPAAAPATPASGWPNFLILTRSRILLSSIPIEAGAWSAMGKSRNGSSLLQTGCARLRTQLLASADALLCSLARRGPRELFQIRYWGADLRGGRRELDGKAPKSNIMEIDWTASHLAGVWLAGYGGPGPTTLPRTNNTGPRGTGARPATGWPCTGRRVTQLGLPTFLSPRFSAGVMFRADNPTPRFLQPNSKRR